MTPTKATLAKPLTETAMPDFNQAINHNYKSQVAHISHWRADAKDKKRLRREPGLSRDQDIEEAA